jgi:hypothetical protein
MRPYWRSDGSSPTAGATTYDEAVRLRGMTFDQAAVEIKARVAQADWPQIERPRSVIGYLQQLTRGG